MITKQALGNTLWGMADILREKVEDYKAYILTLLFFKRLSDNYFWEIEDSVCDFVQGYGVEPNEKQKQKIINNAHDFIIPLGCFWKDVRAASQEEKNEKLNKAVNAIADANPCLKGIINTVRWNEPSPDGSGGKKLHPEVLTSVINYLNAVNLSNKNAPPDVLGDAYQYLIKRFADENKGGASAGQFYTPQEVADIIVRYLKPHQGSSVYDPTCGSGGFLINSAKYAGDKKKIRLYGQEDVWNTWAICNINMILHALNAQIRKGDTLKEPKFVDEENELEIKKFNFVMANFPFSMENWWKNGEPRKDKKGKPKLKKEGSPQLHYPGRQEFSDPYGRFEYGVPPFSNGDFAFIQHIVASVDENGKAGVVCPQGVLFRGQPEKTEQEDGQNRKPDDEYLIRRGFLQGTPDASGEFTRGINIIDAIVFLPGNLFYGTSIPGAILFFNKNKPADRRDKILMVYAARKGWYKEESKMNVLMPHDMLRISTMLEAWGDAEVAEKWINEHKKQLYDIIRENLNSGLAETDLEYGEDIERYQAEQARLKIRLSKKKKQGKKPAKSESDKIKSTEANLKKLLAKKQAEEEEAYALAKKEQQEIEKVENELKTMFADPELRKRYFAIVDMEELEENDFNLNIARYVDTFEPEEEIDLREAWQEFKKFKAFESNFDIELEEILDKI